MEIVIIIGLILLNGIFSMSEIAVISARKSSLINEAKRGNKAAESAVNLAKHPDRFLSTVQVGITLIGIITGLYSGDALADDFSEILINIGVPENYVLLIAKIIIVVIVTYFTIVFGELVPKRIGMTLAEKIAKIIARPMHWLSIIASPFVWVLSKSTSLIFSLFGLSDSGSKVTEEEIKSMIQEGTEDGEVQEVEQNIVERVFTLGDRNLESIMTYRGDIVWIDTDMTNDEILHVIRNNPFDKYPVGNKDLDHIIGIVHLTDLFGLISEPKFEIREIIRPVQYFYENMEVYRALEEMKLKHLQYALVCDEFGALQGIVTLKDIMEGLVGTILDPYEEPEIVQRQDGSYLIDGQCSFYDFLTFFKKGDLYSKYEYNTISGLVIDLLEHIPRTGEIVNWKGLSFEIVDMDGARIDKILVNKL
ncbi:HlyC/CorC family transporter [Dysgonomonas sp. Marseille-P4677]|uniref:hemolysin family protein n=1 Tax=Dysgonomonas sp. Marseille-P4677 TaxID=2364790 RepID=UPI001913C76D|nr:hemolysin family protein [Dysgonomonas sp. Marseille-P4677]MBK5722759.1 HlyC/CorC family transporter [Dysgonomonas sp. Marseille-P4677]